MSDIDVPLDCGITKESPSGSVCESMNSDQVQEILEKLSISEIDTTDSFSVSNNSETSENDKSPSKDNGSSEDGDTEDKDNSENLSEKIDGEYEEKEEKDIDNNYVNSKEANEKVKKQIKVKEKDIRRKSKSEESPKNGQEKKSKKRFSFFRKSVPKETTNEEPPPSPYGEILKIQVESLPQVFIAKYLGCRLCTGIWGAEHTVKPVKDMIDAAKKLGVGKDLSLVKIKVTNTGLEVSPHRENKGPEVEGGLIPVEYISYGVQDFTFTRVFSFIMVREMSYKAKKMECHAYVCPSTLNARKLSLSVALSFKEYAKSLEGKQFRFQVELGQKPVIDDRFANQENEPGKDEDDEEEC